MTTSLLPHNGEGGQDLHLRSHEATDLQSVINELLYVSFGIDGRIRTLTSGFGDRHATVNTTPIYSLPFIAEGLPTPSRRSARLVFTEGIYPSQLSTSFNESSTGSSTSHVLSPMRTGTSNRARTDDLPRMKRMLFQLSYTGI